MIVTMREFKYCMMFCLVMLQCRTVQSASNKTLVVKMSVLIDYEMFASYNTAKHLLYMVFNSALEKANNLLASVRSEGINIEMGNGDFIVPENFEEFSFISKSLINETHIRYPEVVNNFFDWNKKFSHVKKYDYLQIHTWFNFLKPVKGFTLAYEPCTKYSVSIVSEKAYEKVALTSAEFIMQSLGLKNTTGIFDKPLSESSIQILKNFMRKSPACLHD